MNTVELTMDEYQRIMDAILWVLSPYMDDENGISGHPHLIELGECYNESYHKMPADREHNYPELLIY